MRSVHSHKLQKFTACRHIISETAEHGRGHHFAVLFFDAAHHHAEMLRFDNNTDTFGVDWLHEGFCNLAGKALLHLQSTGEAVDETGEFADAVHFVAGDIADVTLAEKGEKMVLAHAVDLDVAHDDHVVALFGEDCLFKDLVRVDVVALRKMIPCFFNPAWGIYESFALGIFADGSENVPN